jgi:two-component system sensor histidine kinase DesK
MLEVEHVARAALAEVRETVSGYRPNLGTELENADATLRGLGIDATIDGDGRDVSGPAGETLAWVVREATTNVVRHSRARHCSIQVVREGDRICMEIGDDGHARNAETADGTGLRGIRERVAAVGGDVSVGTGPGGGFHLRVTVPVASV